MGMLMNNDPGPIEIITAHGLTIPATSRGLGDTIARAVHATGLDKVVAKAAEITGKDCGCKQHQAWLNEHMPYKDRRDSRE